MKPISRKVTEHITIRDASVVLELAGTVELSMPAGLPFEEVAQQIGQALGITFGKDTEGVYEEFEPLTAEALDQHFAVYREPEDSIGPGAGRILLHVMPRTDPAWMGMRNYKYVYGNVAEHLAALLKKRTGLPFKAHPPVFFPDEERN